MNYNFFFLLTILYFKLVFINILESNLESKGLIT